jgi:hypothetical protein
MKKILALILLVTTCFSLSSCFLLDLFGGNDFEYKGEWEVIAYDSARDTLQNQAASVRPDDDVLGDLVTIDATSISYSIQTGARRKETEFINDEITAVYEGQVYDNRRTMFGPLTAFGETMMLWNGPDTGEARNVLLRRNEYAENYDPVNSLISYNNYEMSFSLDALIGEYDSKLVKLNAGYTNAKAFSTREGHNAISVVKEDGAVKFVEEDKTWTVTNVTMNAFLRGVQIEMTSGSENMIITVLEVGENAVCYALNRTDKGELGGQYVTNYGILIKK